MFYFILFCIGEFLSAILIFFVQWSTMGICFLLSCYLILMVNFKIVCLLQWYGMFIWWVFKWNFLGIIWKFIHQSSHHFALTRCCITKLVGLEEHMSGRLPGGAEDRSDSQFRAMLSWGEMLYSLPFSCSSGHWASVGDVLLFCSCDPGNKSMLASCWIRGRSLAFPS
jgi:hypothetical protein